MSIPIGLKKSAAICILRSEAGLLLIFRKKEPHIGKYIPIGGHIDPFETPRAAVIREVQEEAGILVDDVCLCGIMTETSPTKYNWILYIYSADIAPIKPTDHREGTLEWISQDQLSQIPTPTIDHFIYEYVARSEFFVFDGIYNETIVNYFLLTMRDWWANLLLFFLVGHSLAPR